ncbi:hypothetical protein ERJ75_000507300 [Trypanosoma vivax]|uniref:Uncharacterized protein n=1 Tax=Trypanosoma vivax (strain Y486) TaxID=1055687 RepID=F9WVH4_TRYVY|nr:hypothetical protein ERJ75_000507300 [Trypanosoma vivax]CCD21582.1 hypothetical protein, conserved in T.vivax [Trypanosoma vivax Y486]|eukprot:CCD21582.1 hypothetical protein, conserved in T.vivax [Trypanosoma vivax Y486]
MRGAERAVHGETSHRTTPPCATRHAQRLPTQRCCSTVRTYRVHSASLPPLTRVLRGHAALNSTKQHNIFALPHTGAIIVTLRHISAIRIPYQRQCASSVRLCCNVQASPTAGGDSGWLRRGSGRRHLAHKSDVSRVGDLLVFHFVRQKCHITHHSIVPLTSSHVHAHARAVSAPRSFVSANARHGNTKRKQCSSVRLASVGILLERHGIGAQHSEGEDEARLAVRRHPQELRCYRSDSPVTTPLQHQVSSKAPLSCCVLSLTRCSTSATPDPRSPERRTANYRAIGALGTLRRTRYTTRR